MKPRKTIKIADIVAEVNRRNKLSTCDPKVRQGWNALLETLLHNTGNYKGYNYYYPEELGNVTPGIRTEVNEHGAVIPCKDYKERFRDTDDTRIFFYL